MSKAITRAMGSILLILGLFPFYNASQSKDDRLLPETIEESLIFLWPLFLVAGVLLFYLTSTKAKRQASTKAKRQASYKKMLITGLIMLGVSFGSGVVLDSGKEAGGLGTFLIAIFIGVPGLFLTATGLVLMLLQITVFRRKH